MTRTLVSVVLSIQILLASYFPFPTSALLLGTNANGFPISATSNVTLYSQTNTVTDAVMTTETSLFGSGGGSKVLPANFYSVGSTLAFEASGVYSTTGTPGTLTLRLKHSGGATGTVVLGNTGAITPFTSTTNLVWTLRALLTARTTGAGGTLIVNTLWSEGGTLFGASFSLANTSVITVDTTAAQTVDLTAVWSAASQSISCTNLTLSRVF